MQSRTARVLAGAAVTAAALLGAGSPASAEHVHGAVDGSVLRLDSIVQTAIQRGAAPGAAVAIGHSGGDVVIRTYGRTAWSATAPAVSDSTLYDLASLTKVMAATPAAMLLVQQGRLDLDASITRYLAWWPRDGAKGRVTARDLLLHRAGFPADEPLHGLDRADRIQSVALRPLAYAPGSRTIYSDISMVMLAAVVESITHQRIDAFVTRALYVPLEMRDTRFTPLTPLAADPFDLGRLAPTDRSGVGEVNDPIARSLDGISGNAGLFSSIRDVARFAQLMLVGAEGLQTPVLSDSTIRLFTRHSPGSEQALGFDTPTSGSGVFAPYFSDASFGHTGYTGTSLWIDPARDVFVVLLTNRTYPSAANEKHVALRKAVNALVRNDFASASPDRGGLAAIRAALLEGLPRLPGDPDPHAAWFLPREEALAAPDGHVGALGALALLVLLSAGYAVAHQDERVRKVIARARAALVRRER